MSEFLPVYKKAIAKLALRPAKHVRDRGHVPFAAPRRTLLPRQHNAIEKLDAERVLQRFDLMANSALGDTELFSRSREAFAPRRSLERLKGIQRW